MLFKNQYKKKQIEKICKKALIRKSNIFKKFVYIDNKQKNINVIKLKNNKDIMDNLACKKSWDDNKIFLMINKKIISTLFFKKNVDIILCDINWNILNIYVSCKPNQNIEYTNKVKNIWILQENLSKFWEIKKHQKFSYYSI